LGLLLGPANSEAARLDGTVAVHALDPEASTLSPMGCALGDILNAVGRALAAEVRRFGPVPPPWRLAVVTAGGAVLAPRRGLSPHEPRLRRSGAQRWKTASAKPEPQPLLISGATSAVPYARADATG